MDAISREQASTCWSTAMTSWAERDCRRWPRCSAGFCPLDGGSHLRGETVCVYLREAAKEGGGAQLARELPAAATQRVLEVYLEQAKTGSPLCYVLRQAHRYPSRLGKSPSGRGQGVRR